MSLRNRPPLPRLQGNTSRTAHKNATVRSTGTLSFDNAYTLACMRGYRCTWVHLFGAACPERRIGGAIVPPHAEVEAVNIHIAEISLLLSPAFEAAPWIARHPRPIDAAQRGRASITVNSPRTPSRPSTMTTVLLLSTGRQ